MLRLSSTIDQVTVYRQGALVTRVVDVAQPESGWPERILLTGLPLAMQDQSLRVALAFPQGGGGVLANDLRVELEWEEGRQAEAPTSERPDTGPLRERIADLGQQIEVLTFNLARLETLQPGNRVLYEDQPPGAYPLKARRAVVKLRQQLLAKWSEQRRLLMEDQFELQIQLNVLERPIPESPRSPDALSKSVAVSLRSQGDSVAPALRISLSYQMEGARWAPSYTLRFDRDFTLAEVDMRALVCQSSGEVWSNVSLAVSTADITDWKELPELTSRRLGRSQEAPKKIGWRAPPPNTDQLFADYDKGPSALVSPPVVTVPDVAAVEISVDPFAQPPEPFGGNSDPFMSGPPQHDPFAAAQDPFGAPALDPFHTATTHDPFAAQVQNEPFYAPSDPFASAQSDPFASSQADPFAPAQADPFGAPPGVDPFTVPADPFASKSQSPSGMMRRSVASSKPVMGELKQRIIALNAVQQPAQSPPSGWMPDWAEEVNWDLPSADLLSYGLLYLPGVGESGRGKLLPQSALDAGLRALRLRYPDSDVPGRARSLLVKALADCRRALQQPVPSGHTLPSASVQHDYVFTGEHRVELASDCQFHSLPLLRRALPTQMHWLVVPKISCDVFRQAMVESLPDLALPAGPVDVFVGHDFLATTDLSAVTPGETFQIGLGVEQAIKVVRNTHFHETTSGMLGGTLQLQHEVKIEASNQLAREVKLEVREALPAVMEGAEIKVKVDSCEPGWETIPHEPGNRWWLRLPAGETRTAQLNYSIEMASKLELVGGNRREN